MKFLVFAILSLALFAAAEEEKKVEKRGILGGYGYGGYGLGGYGLGYGLGHSVVAAPIAYTKTIAAPVAVAAAPVVAAPIAHSYAAPIAYGHYGVGLGSYGIGHGYLGGYGYGLGYGKW